MVRFSKSKLKETQHIVNGITPILGSTESIVIPISPASNPARENVNASRITSVKTNTGVSSNVYDIINGFDANVDLGLVYSNGYRYQYLDFKASDVGPTGCNIITSDQVVQVQEVTDDGISYINIDVGSSVITTAYVGSPVVPQLPPPNNTRCIPPILMKVPMIPTNNNC
jgi:hypothetical protein